MSEEKGQAAYNLAASINDTIHGKGTFEAEAHNNDSLGRNILKTDLGDFGPETNYALDEETRDRLIAHSRQDIAAAHGHARAAFKAAYGARVLARRTALLSCVILLINLIILAKLL